MKTFALTTALIAAIAAPSFAGNVQLERSLGVEPGVYTTAELARIKNLAEHTGNDARGYFGESSNFVVSSSNTNSAASRIHASIAAESDDSNERRSAGTAKTLVVSTKGVNSRAAAIFAQLAEEGRYDE